MRGCGAQSAGACACSGLSHVRARAAGIFLTGDPSKESIFLTRRKGFVRMAIQAGAGARDQKSSRLLARRVVSFLRCG